MINTKQNQIHRTNKNNIEWHKVALILLVSPLLYVPVVQFVLPPLVRSFHNIECTIDKYGLEFDCPYEPFDILLFIFLEASFVAFIVTIVITKNRRLFHGFLVGFLTFILLIVFFFLFARISISHPIMYSPQHPIIQLLKYLHLQR